MLSKWFFLFMASLPFVIGCPVPYGRFSMPSASSTVSTAPEEKPASNVELKTPASLATPVSAAKTATAPTKTIEAPPTKVTWKLVTAKFAEIEPVSFRVAQDEAYKSRDKLIANLSANQPTTPAEGRVAAAKAKAIMEANIEMLTEAADHGDLHIHGSGEAQQAINALITIGAERFVKALIVRAAYRAGGESKAERLWNTRPKVANTPKAVEAEAEWLYTFLFALGK
jgi:hypothetical protein